MCRGMGKKWQNWNRNWKKGIGKRFKQRYNITCRNDVVKNKHKNRKRYKHTQLRDIFNEISLSEFSEFLAMHALCIGLLFSFFLDGTNDRSPSAYLFGCAPSAKRKRHRNVIWYNRAFNLLNGILLKAIITTSINFFAKTGLHG